MRNIVLSMAWAAILTLAAVFTTSAAEADKRCFEMRVYYAADGKLDDLHARFRDHTVKLFEKHGMTNIGYWVPVNNTNNTLIYILAYPSREAREVSWKAFQADPDWKTAKANSEKNGSLVSKVEQTFLEATDYSVLEKAFAPRATKGDKPPERLFELRTYTASPGKLGNLNARFRDHTVKLFTKHGMTNIGYWVPMKDQKSADETLIYILAHKNDDARKAGFAEFGKDAEWTAALKESEEKAGGPLTIKGGVKSLLMRPTDYSPLK